MKNINNLVDFSEFRTNKMLLNIDKIADNVKTPTRLLLYLGRAKLALFQGDLVSCDNILKTVEKNLKTVFLEDGDCDNGW